MHGRRGHERRRVRLARTAVGRGRHLERIELERAGHADALAGGAHLDHAARGLLALHAEAIDVVEHAPEKESREPVTRKRSRRDASVDERRLHAVAAARAQQVRPDFGFHHDEQPRPHQLQRPIHDEAEIEGKVEHLVDKRQVASGDLLAGHGGRRDEEAQAGVAFPELRKERTNRQYFPDRHRVNPDRLVAVEVEGDREIAHPLRQADDVFPVSNRLVQQIG